jgi:mono/diheme cytochrome c family protein
MSTPAKALPEYSAQTGEPCMTCHISPSGGGPRGPRGQAWVGGGKPGQVPQLTEALESLGVKLDSDPSQFQAPTGEPAAAQPMTVSPAALDALQRRLQAYDGN